jgi:hypothetical protein
MNASKNLKNIVANSLSILREQGELPPQQQPPQPVPAQVPATGQPQQQPATSPRPDSAEKLVDQINKIRSGKSFAEPPIYKSVSDFYDTLPAQDRAVLHKSLDGLIGAVESSSVSGEDTTQTQAQNTPTAQAPIQQNTKPQSSPAVAPAAPVTSGGGGASVPAI